MNEGDVFIKDENDHKEKGDVRGRDWKKAGRQSGSPTCEQRVKGFASHVAWLKPGGFFNVYNKINEYLFRSICFLLPVPHHYLQDGLGWFLALSIVCRNLGTQMT